jgi:prepilin-type N-terminal cleavage/methylation domain-containing protein
MKTQRVSHFKRGFTLMELMVAMAITTIIVTVLVSITSIAIDTWNRSRSELRAARQAKAMVDSMARDFEALVTRSGNEYEWLSAVSNESNIGPSGLQSTNATDLIFFSGSTDRYNGEIGTSADNGGDVSCVGYRLYYKDPIEQGGTTFQTFVLNRILVNPDDTFRDLLGKPDLTTAFQSYANDLNDPENFICENVFQFTVTFQIEVVQGTGATAKVITVPITVGQSSGGQVTDSFRIKGTGIDSSASGSVLSADELKAGRVKAVGISLTVVSDAGIAQLRNRPFTSDQAAEFMAKNSYQYSKLIQLPGM